MSENTERIYPDQMPLPGEEVIDFSELTLTGSITYHEIDWDKVRDFETMKKIMRAIEWRIHEPSEAYDELKDLLKEAP